jgi:hypothetical protein
MVKALAIAAPGPDGEKVLIAEYYFSNDHLWTAFPQRPFAL